MRWPSILAGQLPWQPRKWPAPSSLSRTGGLPVTGVQAYQRQSKAFCKPGEKGVHERWSPAHEKRSSLKTARVATAIYSEGFPRGCATNVASSHMWSSPSQIQIRFVSIVLTVVNTDLCSKWAPLLVYQEYQPLHSYRKKNNFTIIILPSHVQ